MNRSKRFFWAIVQLSLTFIIVITLVVVAVANEDNKSPNNMIDKRLQAEWLFKQRVLMHSSDSLMIDLKLSEYHKNQPLVHEGESFMIYKFDLNKSRKDQVNTQKIKRNRFPFFFKKAAN
jgi:amino acid permease